MITLSTASAVLRPFNSFSHILSLVLITLSTASAVLRQYNAEHSFHHQHDYIVDCFGGIETRYGARQARRPKDYIVDCFGGIETSFSILAILPPSIDYIVDCFGGIETSCRLL